MTDWEESLWVRSGLESERLRLVTGSRAVDLRRSLMDVRLPLRRSLTAVIDVRLPLAGEARRSCDALWISATSCFCSSVTEGELLEYVGLRFSEAWLARDLAEYGLLSGLERPFRPIGDEEFSFLLVVDRVRPRPIKCCSGDESAPPLVEAAEGGLLVSELALSAMDCAELPFSFLPTPKKAGGGPGETAEPGWLVAPPVPPAVVDNFSRALILEAIPPPRFAFFTSGEGCG